VHIFPQLSRQHKRLETMQSLEAVTGMLYGHDGLRQEAWKREVGTCK